MKSKIFTGPFPPENVHRNLTWGTDPPCADQCSNWEFFWEQITTSGIIWYRSFRGGSTNRNPPLLITVLSLLLGSLFYSWRVNPFLWFNLIKGIKCGILMIPGGPGRAASIGVFIPFLITKESVKCCIKDKHWLKKSYFFWSSFGLLKTIREDDSIKIQIFNSLRN